MDKMLEAMRGASGNVGAQAVIAADFLIDSRPDGERRDLRRALDAAAILHWFDEETLAAILQVEQCQVSAWYDSLSKLPFVESWNPEAEGQDGRRLSVHETTRLAWRKRLHSEFSQEFQSLSEFAANYFAKDDAAHGKIEWIYHFLGASPDEAATALEELDREWTSTAAPEHRAGLSSALLELDESRLVSGLAEVEVKLAVLEWQSSLSKEALLEPEAAALQKLAESSGGQSAIARTQCLLGDIHVSKGNIGKAKDAFEKYLQISQQLVAQDSGNAGWLRDLSVAHAKMGDLAEAKGDLGEAHAAYGEDLRIFQELVAQDSGNAGWLRDLAAAHSKMGDLAQSKGNLEEAHLAYGEDLRISQQLVAQDSGNAGWLSDLAIAYSKMGDLAQAKGNLEEVHSAYGEYLRIFQELVSQDSGNAGWLSDLAIAYSKMGDLAQAKGNLEEAHSAYGEYLRIFQELVSQDSGNAGWLRELAIAHSKMGDLAQAKGNLEEAHSAYGEYLRIFQELVAQDPGNAQWAADLAIAETKAGIAFFKNGDTENGRSIILSGLERLRVLRVQGKLKADYLTYLDSLED